MDGLCLHYFSPKPLILSKTNTESTSNTYISCFFLSPKYSLFLENGEKAKYSLLAGAFLLANDKMERNSLMQVAKFLRYNSPSKRQIRRMVGRPKSPNAKEVAAQAAAREPLLYTKKEDAPFAVRDFLFLSLT